MKKAKKTSTSDTQLSSWDSMRRMQRMFDNMFNTPFSGWIDHIDWDFPKLKSSMAMPKVNMSEGKKQVKLEIEVPGCEAKDIEVHIENDVLVVRAKKEREKEKKDEKKQYYYRESSHEEYSRAIPLPANLEAAKTKSKAKNGLLTLTIPKKKVSKSKKKHKVKVNK